MLKTTLLSAAIVTASPGVHKLESEYLVSFPSDEIKTKAKISFHHGLIADQKNGVLFTLKPKEKEILESFGAKVKPAEDTVAAFYEQKKATFQGLNDTGIPGYSCYATVEETLSQIEQMALDNPDYAEVIDIGDSWQKQNNGTGYDLKVLKIGKKNQVDPPILFIQSAMHARELATAGLTLDFAKKLFDERTSDADIAWILDNREIHILFQTNPDGRKIAETGIYQRKNVNENHCSSGSVGVDLNRNFSFAWGTVPGGSSGNACSQTFRGPTPGSEPEVNALEQYARSIFPDSRGPNDTDAAPENTKGLYLDIHSYSELILWPWGGTDTPAPNQKGLEALGKKLAYFNGYYPTQSVGLYPTDGTSDNLAYGELGVAHITFELGTEFFQQCDFYTDNLKSSNIKALMYAAKVSAAPYMLTQGPDLIRIRQEAENGQLVITATATDKRFSTKNGINPTQPISQVRYSFDGLPNDTNSQLAVFSDGNADSEEEAIKVPVPQEILQTAKATVYMQAKDTEGYWGPVSAYHLDMTPPVASGNATCNGAKCALTATNTKSSYQYTWLMPDGTIYDGANLELVMPDIGNYPVELTATNAIGLSHSVQVDVNVTELLAPTVQLSQTCTYLECQFSAEGSSDEDSETLSYSWDFGDGNSLSEMSGSHTYTADGNYTVTVTVTDEHQQSSTSEVVVSVAAEVVDPPVVVPDEPEPQKKSSGGGFGFLSLLLLPLLFRRKT